ncbi:FKBP70, partial [Symbiodinium sp. CCMP2456]
ALQLANYSISMTTLEEVFITLGEQAEREAAVSSPMRDRARENVDFREIEADTEAGTLRLETSETRSAKAMMRLRLRLATANRSAVYSVLILPSIFNILTFSLR